MRILLFFLLLVCIAAGAFGVSRLARNAPPQAVEADIADTHFSFPAAYARDGATQSGGVTDRLAFVATFPDFAPPARSAAQLTPRALTERGQNIVSITVSLPDEAIEPADRPARLYTRFLEGDVWSGPGGLIMRRFERGSPYELEQLYIAPPDGRAFFARCPKQQASDDPAPDMCLSIFRLKSLDVELRFAPLLLERWDMLIERARDFLERVGLSESKRR